jgi:FkbM family methyltransferase
MPSQFHEDRLIRVLFPAGFVGYACEVGAGDGVHLSNTLWLEQEGWDVLCIEPFEELFVKASANRKRVVQVACSDCENPEGKLIVYRLQGSANHGVIPVIEPPGERFARAFMSKRPGSIDHQPVKTAKLDTLLERAEFPRLDFLSVDVDGTEVRVMRGMDLERWKPKVVLIENPFNDQVLHGHFTDRGYHRICQGIGKMNDVYARAEWSDRLYEAISQELDKILEEEKV